jgi:hypothetical protein
VRKEVAGKGRKRKLRFRASLESPLDGRVTLLLQMTADEGWRARRKGRVYLFRLALAGGIERSTIGTYTMFAMVTNLISCNL